MNLPAQDALNAATWSRRSVRHELDGASGFTDPGERVVYERVIREAKRHAILDLGVGTGRTVPFFLPFASEYHAVDCLPAMVDTCRRKHPMARVTLGDARTLGAFASAHFQLVNFSYNGLDAVSHGDRARVLAAVLRVLRPGGAFVFSTLNLDGPTFRERPWRLRVWPTRNPAKYAWRAAKQLASAPVDFVRWLRIAGTVSCGNGCAVAPLSAHHYGILCHYTTYASQLDALTSAGFEGVSVYDSRAGERVHAGDDTSPFDWFHVVARAPERAAA